MDVVKPTVMLIMVLCFSATAADTKASVQYSMAAAQLAAASLTSTVAPPVIMTTQTTYQRYLTPPPVILTTQAPYQRYVTPQNSGAGYVLPQQVMTQNSPTGWIPNQQRQPNLQDLYNMAQQQNRRISFAAGHSISQPSFHHDSVGQYSQDSSPVYLKYPTQNQIKSTKFHYSKPYSTYSSYSPSYSSYTHSKPHFLKPPSFYHHHHPHSDLLDFPISHKGEASSMSGFYSVLMPLALIGISIPALGLMYTYLSKRRRRDLTTHTRGNLEQVEYYLDMLRRSLEQFEQLE